MAGERRETEKNDNQGREAEDPQSFASNQGRAVYVKMGPLEMPPGSGSIPGGAGPPGGPAALPRRDASRGVTAT
jgi:hypothetical protein